MEEWFSRFFQDLQLQLGLRDPKLTAPEKNISGIFLETDTGENIDILLVGKDECVEELRGRTPAEELVRFTSLDFAEYHAKVTGCDQFHIFHASLISLMIFPSKSLIVNTLSSSTA